MYQINFSKNVPFAPIREMLDEFVRKYRLNYTFVAPRSIVCDLTMARLIASRITLGNRKTWRGWI